MGAIAEQLLTSVGLVVYAAAMFLGTAWRERAKWRRRQDVRLAAYVDYSNALEEYVQVAYRLAAAHEYPAVSQPIEVEAGLVALAQADAVRTVKWESLKLLGSREAIAAARSWHKAAWELSWIARRQTMSHAEYIGKHEEMGCRRNEFYTRARAHLGARNGDHAWLSQLESGNGEGGR
ncbi:hypothetical protein ACFWF7_43500 [Nocardia sp. NPDC060256]|uniref:hypothetical protein n=1 Tax=unclassified Nocardia TaxID=2637762 RepID=UPI0036610B17